MDELGVFVSLSYLIQHLKQHDVTMVGEECFRSRNQLLLTPLAALTAVELGAEIIIGGRSCYTVGDIYDRNPQNGMQTLVINCPLLLIVRARPHSHRYDWDWLGLSYLYRDIEAGGTGGVTQTEIGEKKYRLKKPVL